VRMLAALTMLLAVLAPAGPAAASASPLADAAAAAAPVGSYTSPPFQCAFTEYGEGVAPPLDFAGPDPLCVEYQKRDITLTNGGAVGFALAEPARLAIAVPACQYWQIDHWRVQVSPGDDTVVQWDGAYWFDKGRLTAASAFRRFSIGGESVSAQRAADTLRPASPQLADTIEQYGVSGGFGMALATVADVDCANPLR
jgi:hypothetical protein